MLEGSYFTELPDLEDKYTELERSHYDSCIANKLEVELKLVPRFNQYKADVLHMKRYAKALNHMPVALPLAGDKDLPPLFRAISSHQTVLALSIINESDHIDLSCVIDDKLVEPQFSKDMSEVSRSFYESTIPIIHWALFYNEVEVVRALIKKWPSLKESRFHYITPLLYAIQLSYYYGYDRQVIALELIGADVNLESENPFGRTSLYLAQGLPRIAIALLRKGANTRLLRDDKALLQYLMSEGCETTAIALINEGASIDSQVNSPYRLSGLTLLQYAKQNNQRGVVLALVRKGAQDDCFTSENRVLLWAVIAGESAIAFAILEQTSKIEGDYGQQLLYTAIRFGRTSIAIALCSQVDVNGFYEDNIREHYHLETALDCRNAEVALALIRRGVVMPLGRVAYLHKAIHGQLSEVVNVLLEKGADSELGITGIVVQEVATFLYENGGGSDLWNLYHDIQFRSLSAFEAALRFYCSQEHRATFKRVKESADVVAVLYKHRRHSNICTLYHNMPLIHFAIFENEDELAHALINCNASELDIVYDEKTPLHYAILRNRTDVALALIGKGASLNTSYKNMTPLHHAIRENNTAVAVALIAKDPDVNNHPRYRGMTTLEHSKRVQGERVRYFLAQNQSEELDNPIVAELKKHQSSSNAMVVDVTPIESEVRVNRIMKIG